MAFFSTRSVGGTRLGARTWTPTNRSKVFGSIPFDSAYVRVISKSGVHNNKCQCTRDCICHTSMINTDASPPCPCDAEGRECSKLCPGCDVALYQYNIQDNRQIQRKGIAAISGLYRWKDDKWKYGFYANKTAIRGDLVGCYEGEITPKAELDPNDRYTYEFNEDLIVKLVDGIDARLPDKYQRWVVTSTKLGTDLNFVNTTCNHNNLIAFTVWVDGIPHIAFYLTMKVEIGMFLKQHTYTHIYTNVKPQTYTVCCVVCSIYRN